MLIWDGNWIVDTESNDRLTLPALTQGILFTDPPVWGYKQVKNRYMSDGVAYDRASVAFAEHIVNMLYIEDRMPWDKVDLWCTYIGNGVVSVNMGTASIYEALRGSNFRAIEQGVAYLRHFDSGCVRIEFDDSIDMFIAKSNLLRK